MQTISDELFLSNLLKDSRPATLKTDDISRLIGCFLPSKPAGVRSSAFVVVSAICAHWTSKAATESDAETAHHARIFTPEVERRLSDVDEQPALEAIVFVAALFAIDWHTASSIFTRDGFQEAILDIMDLHPNSNSLPVAVAGLFAQACGHKVCRTALDQKSILWLESSFKYAKDNSVATKVVLAMIKLSRGAAGSDSLTDADASEFSKQDDEYHERMKNILLDQVNDVSLAADAVEGLAYLSADPEFKERIIQDTALSSRFVSFRAVLYTKGLVTSGEHHSTLCYGLAAIVANLCTYRPRLTEEQAQFESLRKMTNSNSRKSGLEASKLIKDDDKHVMARGKVLVKAGAVDLLFSIVRASESLVTRRTVGRAMLGLIEDKENRGNILQGGGSKLLMMIIRSTLQALPASSSKVNVDSADLATIQALAKLAITSSPLQVFGPDENVTIEAIRPLVYLLLSDSSTLLQRFEALMSLTNLASSGPNIADRVAGFEGMMNKLEFLLLDENVMVRRAATELLCNLVAASESTFSRYTGDVESRSGGSQNTAKARLHVLTALSDVDDEATRLASSGALAAITSSKNACQLLMMLELEQHHHVLNVFKQLIDPVEDGSVPNSRSYNQGLLHRGVVCVRNMLSNLTGDLRKDVAKEAERHGLVSSLVNVVKSSQNNEIPETILRPALEALKCLVDAGISVTL